MNLPNYNKILEHFVIPENKSEEMTVFDSRKIEQIGSAIAYCLVKGKGRAIIDYDPAYPYAILRICTDTPNTSEIFKVTCEEGQYSFEPIALTDSKD